jgi:hypothetical protein
MKNDIFYLGFYVDYHFAKKKETPRKVFSRCTTKPVNLMVPMYIYMYIVGMSINVSVYRKTAI